MATVKFIAGNGPQDWNDPDNWQGGAVPTATENALLVTPETASATWAVISGGMTDLINAVTLKNTGLVVGGSVAFGGTGSGTLTASGSITTDTNNIVSTAGSTITAEGGFYISTSQGALGGGGTFDARSTTRAR